MNTDYRRVLTSEKNKTNDITHSDMMPDALYGLSIEDLKEYSHTYLLSGQADIHPDRNRTRHNIGLMWVIDISEKVLGPTYHYNR